MKDHFRTEVPGPEQPRQVSGNQHSPLWTASLVVFMLIPGLLREFVASTNSGSIDQWPFPCPKEKIAHYTAYRVRQPLRIDGRLDEEAWRRAPQSTRFTDLITGNPAIHDTRSAVLWDNQALYVAFWVEEPDVKATLTERDSPIYENNDVEVFIAGKDGYYEFEVNAFNTIYEVFFIWEQAYETGDYSSLAEFKRSNPKVRSFNGVGFRNHPRGKRVGSWAWDFPGLQTAVQINGTINDSRDKDQGWTVELAFPWAGMRWLAKADNRALPPKVEDVWRIDFSRFNQYKGSAEDSGGWAWSRHGIWDSHIPECFPYIHFSGEDVTHAKSVTERE